jgi:exopolyphosphatase/guanosine-5'-triphosphate,3'-diphosphate pyrophosphatase
MSPPATIRVGAVDIGSNSLRLLVADVPAESSEPIRTVARAGEPCRLGRGLERTGVIESALADRAASLTSDFLRRARALGARRFMVGATAALRNAENGSDVARRIQERAGVPVRILTGDEEARLVYEAVVRGLGAPARRSSCVVFDLGGGSTEVVSGLGELAGRWVSLPFGAVSLTERHLHHSPARPEEIQALEDHVRLLLEQHCSGMPEFTPVLAGVGGTVTGIAILDQGLPSYEPDRVEGWIVEAERLERLVERIASSSEAERKRWTVLGRGRVDIVVAGALAVRVLMQRFRARGLICSTQGLRYGLARMAIREGA